MGVVLLRQTRLPSVLLNSYSTELKNAKSKEWSIYIGSLTHHASLNSLDDAPGL